MKLFKILLFFLVVSATSHAMKKQQEGMLIHPYDEIDEMIDTKFEKSFIEGTTDWPSIRYTYKEELSPDNIKKVINRFYKLPHLKKIISKESYIEIIFDFKDTGDLNNWLE